ncbi:MAG TPA: BrnA antitoxin family protein [Candidatus Angelobacter sp.]|nr:BrnA antitoxin family protein [Candidatus Angelobacter sp.]
MKKATGKHRQMELQAITMQEDQDIDFSEIPELTEEQLRKGVRGQMYRPFKKPVTMRLDADVLEWLKEGGRGYQTKANALLRKEMLRSVRQKKSPSRVPNSQTTPRKQRSPAK